MKEYEAIIIGGGGGLKLRPISELGHKVAVIEKEDLGGTCLNRGCIPSKMLIHPADLVKMGGPREDFSLLVQGVTEHVSGTSARIAEAYAKNPNVDFYHGEGRFVSNKVVEVNGEQITANKIFIAVGSRPRVPKIEGLEDTPFWTSREALRATKLPKRMIVIGGGYIGVELGHFYREMGSEVHFLVRSKMLRQEDEDVVEEFLKDFDDGNVHFGVSPTKVEHDGKVFTVTLDNGEIMQAEALFVAAGIVPNTDRLNLESTEIELTEKGFVKVDDHLQTTVEDVYALGDVAGNFFFRHSVNFEGEYLLWTLYTHPIDEAIVYPPMPHAVFSNPQIAGIGATERELQEQDVDYVVGKNFHKDSAYGGDVLGLANGFVKLLFDRASRKLLGAHIVGPESATMIHMCIAYLNMQATVEDMHGSIYIHPAFPETIRNAVRKAKAQF